MAIEIPCRQLFIDGEWREPVKKNRLPVINPSTEQIIGNIPAATAEDVEIAVDAARRALARSKGRDWASASGAYRAKYLRAIAAKITLRKSELAKLEAIDCGKPLDETAGDINAVARCFEYYEDLAEGLDAKQKTPVPLPMESFKYHVLKEPIGVVGLITPWNYPLLMAAWKAAPALAAGWLLASVTCLELAEVCKEVGLPPGVLNILTGLGPEAGAPLVSHPHVDKYINWKQDHDCCSPNCQAAEWTIFGVFLTNDQICNATSQLLVHESIATEFLDRLVKWCKNIKILDPMEEGCRLGPVVSAGQHEKVMKFISTAKSEGATILCGGARPQHLKKGYFVEPTIITDVTTSMQIWREEVFGPVLCVKTFSTEDEAIELANDTQYGLGAAMISRDLDRCERVTKAFQAGIVWVNCSQPYFSQAPSGGNKRAVVLGVNLGNEQLNTA
ncbi:hypothetical protein Vadar_014599 [Vaccinium darrowii]|uniref:Uncharacterized protein n=1 Tax=Vaccinium darrowii TaxID=229202 RepID=A0ACB7ZKK8_9ERIC|nr:hypothetical protein Vadar_014599 [Vaccinium darrowii]